MDKLVRVLKISLKQIFTFSSRSVIEYLKWQVNPCGLFYAETTYKTKSGVICDECYYMSL